MRPKRINIFYGNTQKSGQTQFVRFSILIPLAANLIHFNL
ncbi:hypothetical protein HMPREF0971_03144 [Segatella oris F0302]|uniref:Uncharacterized protein n=1 Tax=Segatella oris F0302 TaxID=649760 RepID=D1QVV3_9BACT|nr:hypothetical protein HMPREF0971_03144 [Segatella oris F0302]